ncbi:hypothetical protein, partial [uncultured Paracoccus sp.]|uniref:hypothetical protein n=1 Tax=uncultured Paracoccus sp. TaxID=189685 RepID=UPI0025DD4612
GYASWLPHVTDKSGPAAEAAGPGSSRIRQSADPATDQQGFPQVEVLVLQGFGAGAGFGSHFGAGVQLDFLLNSDALNDSRPLRQLKPPETAFRSASFRATIALSSIWLKAMFMMSPIFTLRQRCRITGTLSRNH